MTFWDDVTDWIGNIAVDQVWIITLVLILVSGLFLMWRIDWPNFKLTESIHIMRHRKTETNGISTMGSFFVALSARMGAGNIIGVAVALIVGGPGAILWMWIFSLFGAVLCFAECTLGQIYKEKKPDGLFRGGPAYYAVKGAHSKTIATIFAVLLIVIALVLGGVQACNMNNAIRATVNLDPYLVGLIIASALAIVIYVGLVRITKFISFLVPVFALIWIVAVIATIIQRADAIPGAIGSIFSYGLGVESLAGAGFGLIVITGFKRGAFCSEGGTGQISSVSSSADDDHPCVQGYIQAFGVYVDIFFICTMSALLVLTYGVDKIPFGQVDQAIPLIIDSLEVGFLGEWAKPFFSVIIIMITFASICGNYVFAESNTRYLYSDNRKAIWALNVLYVATVYVMSTAKFGLVWALGDILVGLLIILDVYVIYKLYRYVSRATKDYRKQRREGVVSPTFNAQAVFEGMETTGITEWKRRRSHYYFK